MATTRDGDINMSQQQSTDDEQYRDEIEMPVKSVDPDATVEDRLTSNAYNNILPARYLLKNEDGELIEDPEDLFDRVAKNVSVAEAFYGDGGDALVESRAPQLSYEDAKNDESVVEWADEFRHLMETQQFMPNCVAPSTTVGTPAGTSTITDISAGDEVSDDTGPASVAETFDNGTKVMQTIKTGNGYSVTSSKEHLFRVVDESGEYSWKMAGEIAPGDNVVLQSGYIEDVAPADLDTDISRGEKNEHTADLQEQMTTDLAEWLGFVIGDGHVRDSGVRVAFDERDDSIDRFVELSERLFDVPTKTRERSDAACVVASINSVEVVRYIRQNEMSKPSSESARVPDPISTSGASAVSAFLSALFDADGSVEDRAISLYTKSEELADGVQQLLLGLGIRSKRQRKRDGYRVSIRKNEHGRRFVERVGFVSSRKQRSSERFLDSPSNATTTKIPNQQRRLLEWYRSRDDLGHDFYKRISQFVIDSESSHSQDISIEFLQSLSNEYPAIKDCPVWEYVERGQFVEEVESVEHAGRMRAVDLNVPDRNTFVADGFASHNSPTLMNAGADLQQLSACIAGHAPVYTRDGLKRMDEVEVGDEVLTHEDRFKEVTAHWSNGVKDTVEMLRGTSRSSHFDVQATPDHEILNSDGEWVRVDELESPANPTLPADEPFPELIDLTQYTSQLNKETAVVEDNGRVKLTNADDSRTPEYDQQNNQPTAHVVNDEKVGWLIGLYLAEGDIYGSDVRFTLGADESNLAETLIEYVETVFDLSVSISESNHGEWTQYRISSAFVADFFATICGTGFDKKRLPKWVGDADDDYRQAVLDALLAGDGCDVGTGYRLVLDNPTLVYESTLLARSLGYDAVFKQDMNRDLSANETSGCYISTSEKTTLDNVVRQDADEIEVYDMEVEDDHSFVVGDFVAHNCFVLEPRDDMQDIFQTSEDAALVFKSGGGVGYAFSHLRPKGAYVQSTGGVSSGPISFMQVFDTTCQTVEQGGCIEADTRVMTDDGYVPLREVHDAPPLRQGPSNSLVYSRDGKLHTVVESSDSGELPVQCLETERGYSITATPNHPVLVVRDGETEFTPVEEIESGDTLVLDQTDSRVGDVRADLTTPAADGSGEYHANVQRVENLPSQVTDDVARFLGVLWANGAHDTTNDRLAFTFGKDGNADPDAKEFVVDFLEGFGLNVHIEDEEKRGKGRCERVEVRSQEFCDWLDTNGLAKESVDRIPEPIYRSPGAIPAFLGGLTCDAHIAADANTVTYSMADEELATTVQDLLLLCGIPANRYEVPPQESQYSDESSYGVQVTPGKGATTFDQNIPHFLDSNGVLGEGGQRQNRVPFAPELLDRVLGEHFERDAELPDNVDRDAMESLRRYQRGERTPSRKRLVECLDAVGIDSSEIPVLDSGHLFETVESNEDAGTEYVYDIEVMDGAPEFVAENFVVHNKRRGAQMGIMRVDHADIGRFVTAKREEGVLDNFNISVALTDEFIDAVRNDEAYTFYDPASDYEEPQEVLEETKQFYSPEFEDNPVDWEDDREGELVDENLWRDHGDSIDAYTDYEDGSRVSFGDKWRDAFYEVEERVAVDEETDEIVDMPIHEAATADGYTVEERVTGEPRIDLTVGEPLELPARFIWDLIIDGAWRNGEPGLFHYDETNEQHSFDVDEHPQHAINATNPCVVAGTKIQTPDGPRNVEDVDLGDRISTVRGSERVDEVLTFEDVDVYDVTFTDGGSLTVTEDHRFHTLDGKHADDVPLRDLEVGDFVRLDRSTVDRSGTGEEYDRQLRRGILVGNGCYTQKTIQHNNTLSISSSDQDGEYNDRLVDLFENEGYDLVSRDDGSGHSTKFWFGPADEILEDHDLEPAPSHEKNVDPTEFRTEAQIVGFLDGLLASDGNVNTSTDRPQLRWTTASNELAHTIRTLCLNIGAHARIYEDARKQRGGTRADGSKILTERTVDDIHVAGESLREYVSLSRLDSVHPRKGKKLLDLPDSWALTGGTWKAKIESIEPAGTADTVYDLYCSGSDTWIADGYVQRGCAEQPLSEYEACNLGHINLSLMMREDSEPFEKWQDSTDHEYSSTLGEVSDYVEENVDFEQLRRVTRSGTRFLDNVVTMSDFPLEEITERVRGQRKIGLGIMGWAQMLYQMGIPYGTEESYHAARVIMRFIDKESVRMSHELATERGTFEYWDESKYAAPTEYPEWFHEHTYEDPTEWEDGFPIRNHNTTTIAPTGTTSMIADTSGGCEPVSSVAYFKNVGDDIQGDDMLVEFDDYFLRTLEANDIDVERVKSEAEEQMRNDSYEGVSGLSIPDEIADAFVVSGDLSSTQHTMMQRSFQEFVDSGISKTINAPNYADRGDVHDAFMLALDDESLGQTIKGLTFYRTGSRSTEVLKTSVTNKNKKGEEVLEDLQDLHEQGEVSDELMAKLGLDGGEN